MLDVIVLIAMAVTAVAFAAGLTVQAGLPLVPVLIGTAALFLVMATSFLSMARGSRGGAASGGDRLAELEEALEIIDGDLQRLDQVEDGLSRLDTLSETVARLDQTRASGEGAGGAELEGVYSQIEALRAEIAAATAGSRTAQAFKPTSEPPEPEVSVPEMPPAPPPLPEPEPVPVEKPFSLMDREPEPEPEAETLIVEEVVETVVIEPEPEVSAALQGEPQDEPQDEPEDEPKDEPQDDEAIEEVAVAETVESEPEPQSEPEPESETDLPAAALWDDDEEAAEERMLGILREGISEGRVDLYLQPTITLPDRKVRYFEALTRIRKTDDEIVLPGEYMPAAKRSGLMPLIDNVLLVRSVQVLRRVGQDTRIKGVFGNVSMHSLLDPDYYPELIEFMEENTSLSDNLIFEISQMEMLGLTQSELACLDTLGALGYTFCLDNVSDMETDFSTLSDRYFRHVKVSAASFLGGPGRKASDLKRQLDGLGMQLIIEKVENEGDVAELLDHGIELAQGYLFGEPRPMNAALSKELEDAGAS